MTQETKNQAPTPSTFPHFKIARKPEVLNQFGFGNTQLYAMIKDGTMPPSIQLGGERSIGFLQNELDAILSFMAAGKSKEDIRILIRHLVKQRQTLIPEEWQNLPSLEKGKVVV